MVRSATISPKILVISQLNGKNYSWSRTAVRTECAAGTYFNTCFLELIFDRMVTSKGIFTNAKITGKP